MARPERFELPTPWFVARYSIQLSYGRNVFYFARRFVLSQHSYNNGITHVVLEPLDFLERLAAPVPRPRVNLTRYHGVFAPNSAHRALVTRAGRGKGRAGAARADVRPLAERRAAMRWAQRLKRVFGIDIEACAGCGGMMCIIACIEDPAVIKAILAHLAGNARPVHAPRLPPGRAPPAPAQSSPRTGLGKG